MAATARAVLREREKALALPQLNDEIGTRHLMWMCRQIYNGWIPDSLAPIWIGYVQGVFRAGGGPNVKELAEMIRQALEEKGDDPEVDGELIEGDQEREPKA